MFTVIKKETAWREVGRKGRGGGEEEKVTGGGDWHRHHNCLDGTLGFPSHPDPRAVLDLWSQVPVGFFLGTQLVPVSRS